MVIGSGGVFLGPIHQVVPLAGSSTFRKHKSPRGCVAGVEGPRRATKIRSRGCEIYSCGNGVNSGTRPRPVRRPSVLGFWMCLKGPCQDALHILIRVRREVLSSQPHLFHLRKKNYLTSHITKPLMESRFKQWIKELPEPLRF